MQHAPTLDDFTPYVGRRFRIGPHEIPMVLASAEAQPVAMRPGSAHAPFALIFQGPAGNLLPMDIHRAAVEDGPVFEFHVMPIHTPATDRQDYQVVFN